MKQLFSFNLKGIVTIAMSFFMPFIATKTNAQWIELGGTNNFIFNDDIKSIATDSSGNVYAGGRFNDINGYYVAEWNGTAWSKLSRSSYYFNGPINSVATDAVGNVYAGGDSYENNGNFFVAKWNGTAWDKLGGSPFNGRINSIAIDPVGNVYAAGNFTDATNGNYYVAKWNGTTWSELGGPNNSPFNDFIFSIAIDASGNVYAGGEFADPNDHQYVAKWNGTAWSELGGTDNTPFGKFSSINSIATDVSGNVYAGGDFTDANNDLYVEKWNGTTWSELDGNSSLSNYFVNSIATDAVKNVYAGGEFVNFTGQRYVAKWNGTAWDKLGGSPFNYAINSVSIDPSGNVYAGGGFSDINGNRYVAKYPQNILPVTLVDITATKEKKGVAINWQTAEETNCSYFNVQRSTGSNSFINIGTVKAVGTGTNSYQFIDNNPANGINYYRLQSVDKDGGFVYSLIRTINEVINFSVSIYPNPVHNNISLNFNSDKTNTVEVQIVNNEGKVITTQQIQIATGRTMQNINIASLTNGEYYVRLLTQEGQIDLKFVKER